MGDSYSIRLFPRTMALITNNLMSSPVTMTLLSHVLIIIGNSLTAIALAFMMIAVGFTLVLQCFSVFILAGKFAENIFEVGISSGARLFSSMLSRTCFSRGATGEREKMAVGGAFMKVIVDRWWTSVIFSIAPVKLYDFYQSWPFYAMLIAQVWLQLLAIRVEDISRRGESSNCRKSRKDRIMCFILISLDITLLGSLIGSNIARDPSFESLAMMRSAICAFCQGVLIERQLLFKMGSAATSGNYGYVDSEEENKLNSDVFRLILQTVLHVYFCFFVPSNRRVFLFFLLVYDAFAVSEPIKKMLDAVKYERHLKKKYPRLSAIEFSAIDKDETCPVCLESHFIQETVRLPCGHLVHSSCVVSMARVAAASVRRYRAGHQYPLASSAHSCPICRATLHFDDTPTVDSNTSNTSTSTSSSTSSTSSVSSVLNRDPSIAPRVQSSQVHVPTHNVDLFGVDIIRRTFGGRVLLAMTDHHLRQEEQQQQQHEQRQQQSITRDRSDMTSLARDTRMVSSTSSIQPSDQEHIPRTSSTIQRIRNSIRAVPDQSPSPSTTHSNSTARQPSRSTSDSRATDRGGERALQRLRNSSDSRQGSASELRQSSVPTSVLGIVSSDSSVVERRHCYPCGAAIAPPSTSLPSCPSLSPSLSPVAVSLALSNSSNNGNGDGDEVQQSSSEYPRDPHSGVIVTQGIRVSQRVEKRRRRERESERVAEQPVGNTGMGGRLRKSSRRSGVNDSRLAMDVI